MLDDHVNWTAWRGRYWNYSAEELNRFAGIPLDKDGHTPDFVALTPEAECRVEQLALHAYLVGAMAAFLVIGMITAFVAAGLSWRTLVIVFAVLIGSPPIARLVTLLVWPFECNYRRLIGQFHDGYLPAVVNPVASYWPIAVLRKSAPILAAIAFVFIMNALVGAIGL